MATDWVREVGAADWVLDRLHPFGMDVGSIIPEGFEAYVRIFHPVRGSEGRTERWADIARANRRLAHREMQLHMISRPPGAPAPTKNVNGEGYDAGSLRRSERAALVETLREATNTPQRCWFCVWEGFGGLDDGGVAERVRAPDRAYLLASGPIEQVLDSFLPPFDQSPNLWWPDDRAWVVGTEIDHAWTYVGGTRTVVQRLLQDDRIEALEAMITDQFWATSDVLNAALDDA